MTGKVFCSVSHSLYKISLSLWSHNRIVPCLCREFVQLFTKASDSNIIMLLITLAVSVIWFMVIVGS